MSAKRTFGPGRLLAAVFGISRGVTVADWVDPAITTVISIQQWGDGINPLATGWQTFTPPQTVSAYAGLPFTNTIPAGSVVWMFYLFGTYFVVLTSC